MTLPCWYDFMFIRDPSQWLPERARDLSQIPESQWHHKFLSEPCWRIKDKEEQDYISLQKCPGQGAAPRFPWQFADTHGVYTLGFFCKATRFSPQTSSALETVYNKLPNIFLLFHFLMTEDNSSLKHSIRPLKKLFQATQEGFLACWAALTPWSYTQWYLKTRVNMGYN